MMHKSCRELKTITDDVYSGSKNKWAKEVIGVLQKNSIKLRQKDGKLYSVNISIPNSENNCIFVGIRYIKSDNTFMEDHFLFELDKPIVAFYKGRIEKVLFEYKSAHKQQIV